ncbi:ATP-binding protein [Bacillus cereus]|uniref:ATP-binding protein n=1 Tax=Bacillus cereus TaxID=1396 RepID=UPI000BF78055|nr:ATP-binding protein [Bacillus cereus]PFR51034.1 hypothetical protein COK35_07660 [Bacillus cereus]
MFIKYLRIKSYKKLKDFEISFSGNGDFRKEFKEFYGDMNFTVLVGENGVGKTTVMSFIANIFYNLERYHSRIPSDFELQYNIFNNHTGKYHEVKLCKKKENIFIQPNTDEQEYLLLERIYRGKGIWHSRRKKDQLEIVNEDIKFNDIIGILPSEVITSAFSIHGEYPSNRNGNYKGRKILKNYNVDVIYGKNHFGGLSISAGISKFIQQYIAQKELIENLLQKFNLEFGNAVRIYNVSVSGEEGLFEEEYWINLSELDAKKIEELFELEQNNKIYFNDLIFFKSDALITLNEMSSGEKMFFYRIFSIMSSISDNSLVIIEEPELHLNPSWIKQIISMFYSLFKDYKSHFIIATHSYSFINTLFPDNILIFKNNEAKNPSFNTFLAGEKEIIYNMFEHSNVENYPEFEVMKKIKLANKKELKEMMNFLGESLYRFIVYNEIENSED